MAEVGVTVERRRASESASAQTFDSAIAIAPVTAKEDAIESGYSSAQRGYKSWRGYRSTWQVAMEAQQELELATMLVEMTHRKRVQWKVHRVQTRVKTARTRVGDHQEEASRDFLYRPPAALRER